jgi:DUF4097 and DUF4098 domain-containing protein YvlB
VFALNEEQANAIDKNHSIIVAEESGSTAVRSQQNDQQIVGSKVVGSDVEESREVSDSQISRQSFKLLLPKNASMNVRSALGDVAIQNTTGQVVIRCPVGEVLLKNIEGSVDIKAGSGTIACDHAIGDISTESGAGSVKLGFVRGNVHTITSSGNITLDKVEGTVNSTSQTGDISINIASQPRSNCKVYTDFGSLRIGLAGELKLHINGKLIGGQIDAPFGEVETAFRSQTLDFLMNGGGPVLVFGSQVGNAAFAIQDESN